MEKNKIILGDLVQDKISGFRGIAIIESRHVTGCLHYYVQTEVNPNSGFLPDKKPFDVDRLKVVQKQKYENQFNPDEYFERIEIESKLASIFVVTNDKEQIIGVYNNEKSADKHVEYLEEKGRMGYKVFSHNIRTDFPQNQI